MVQTEGLSDDDLGYRVVATVADELDVDPIQIDEPLYDVVDIERVERIIQRSSNEDSFELSLSFQFAGCHVTVSGDGTVRARPTK